MIGLSEYDPEFCCYGCGVNMEGSHGPPGPRHHADCPVEQQERLRAEREAMAERRFWSRNPVRHWSCGCRASEQGVEEPCFQPNCALLRAWMRRN